MTTKQLKTDLQDLLRLFLGDDFLENMPLKQKPSAPATDVYMTKHEVIVVMDLPGIENIDEIVTRFNGQKLIIQGNFTSPYQGYEPVQVERSKGSFQKEIILPFVGDRSKRTARYRRGVLELRFSK